MIVITGAAGFIGSCLVSFFNQKGIDDLLLVDDFSPPAKIRNLEGKRYLQMISREDFINWAVVDSPPIEFVFHLGARTDTTEKDKTIFDTLNLAYSQAIWDICSEKGIPLVYASSAATYGLGEYGFADDHDMLPQLHPLNPYGESKHEFDLWALGQEIQLPYWVGLKFFNVYGPNEYHKGRMASVVYHAFHQVKETGAMKLFRSHHANYADGEQERDFIYIKDLLQVLDFFYEAKTVDSGIYNLGTGKAATFNILAHAVFKSLNQPPQISYIDIPADIRDTYQYFTEAPMKKLRAAGYTAPFTSLEEGILDYVQKFLLPEKYL
ncbi:MAG: ADP-glyceromanno-heptose 6-epimerase [Chitinophagales bacterium]|nr:ADP-glyceromanno-heptose 6-epimerase [Chitinophagales bacterium]